MLKNIGSPLVFSMWTDATTGTPRTLLKANESWTFSRPVFTCRRTMFQHALLSQRAHCNNSIVTFCCVCVAIKSLSRNRQTFTPGLDNELCALNENKVHSRWFFNRERRINHFLRRVRTMNKHSSSHFHTKEGKKVLCKAECHVRLIKLQQCSTEGVGETGFFLMLEQCKKTNMFSCEPTSWDYQSLVPVSACKDVLILNTVHCWSYLLIGPLPKHCQHEDSCDGRRQAARHWLDIDEKLPAVGWLEDGDPHHAHHHQNHRDNPETDMKGISISH